MYFRKVLKINLPETSLFYNGEEILDIKKIINKKNRWKIKNLLLYK